MLVTFQTKAFSNITMFGDVAIKLLRLMGHSGTVPSAIEPEDIPEALKKLKIALEGAVVSADETDDCDKSEDSEEETVSLKHRALPLIQLLEAAEKENVPVMWNT